MYNRIVGQVLGYATRRNGTVLSFLMDDMNTIIRLFKNNSTIVFMHSAPAHGNSARHEEERGQDGRKGREPVGLTCYSIDDLHMSARKEKYRNIPQSS